MFRRRTSDTLKTLLSITLLSVVVLAASCRKTDQPSSSLSSVVPGGEFEGIIAMKIDSENQKGAGMTYFLKGKHTRIEMKVAASPEGQGVMLWDLEGAKMTTLIPSRKMYMTTDLKETAASLREATKEKPKGEEEETKFPKLTPTGKTETIAGYSCEHWLIGDKQDMDMCVAKGLGYFGMGGQTAGGFGSMKSLMFNPKLLAAAAAHPEWVKFLQGGAFPLKMTAMEDGKVHMTMEATRIERKPLDDSLFAIPPDYKELNMQNLKDRKQ
ncbi:MAG: DUF4412 domain-containing protein [Acidobacteriota bacterium]|nr:DUF4412 domain-containing protein [Acidobacteriota bacterium]